MSWPEMFELTLDGIAQGGEGVGRWEERVVFARGGLPGERVRVAVRERHDAYAHADVVEVLDPSPDRVAPRLPDADHMPWQHIAYPAQVRFKRQILADQLAKIGGLIDLDISETLASPRPWGYRSSARLHGEGARVGYYAANSRELRTLESDPLLLPVLDDVLRALGAVVHENGQAPAEVLLRASEAYGYAVAALREPETRADHNLPAFANRWRMRAPSLAGVVLPAARGAPASALGADRLIEELGGVAFHLRPTTFFQVNVAAAEQLLGLVRSGLSLQRGERLLDLYCGAGTFALPLARSVGEVVGLDEAGGSIEDGRLSATENGIANVQFVVGRVEAAIGALEGPFDAVVLDPPRRGCHPRALEQLLRLAPARIVYVSCHPATLARDLKVLVGGGYKVARVQPVDLFPQTAHIESVTVLVR